MQPTTECCGLCQRSCPTLWQPKHCPHQLGGSWQRPARPACQYSAHNDDTITPVNACHSDWRCRFLSAVLSLWLWRQQLQPRSKLPLPRPVFLEWCTECVCGVCGVCACVGEAALAHWGIGALAVSVGHSLVQSVARQWAQAHSHCCQAGPQSTGRPDHSLNTWQTHL